LDNILKFTQTLSGNYHVNPHEHSEAIQRVAYDTGLLSVIREYIGTEPLFVGSYLWWNQLMKTPDIEAQRPHGQKFHFDVPDFRSLVVFFYLCDVDEGTSPHVVIEGTHTTKSLKEIRNYYLTDAEAQEAYGNQIRVITGPAGTGFFEEQTIFHKHIRPKKPRLMLGLSYALQRRGVPQV
jgi:hypothetical protein